MTRNESLFAEIIFDLSTNVEHDKLYKCVEDSRELFMMVKDWAEEFDMRYPMSRLNRDFSEIHKIDYLTAIDNFYEEKKTEFFKELCTNNPYIYKLVKQLLES